MGDINKFDVKLLAKAALPLIEQGATVLVLSAPPCPDYSSVKANAPGRKGPSGKLFGIFCDALRQIRKMLPRKTRVALVVENVRMTREEDVRHFSKELGCEPALIDPSDYKAIRRPRLWWTDVQWLKGPARTMVVGPQSVAPRLTVFIQGAPDMRPHLAGLGLRFPPEVLDGKHVLPTFLTPADSDKGRDAPRSTARVSKEAMQRWSEGNRQYAPWLYESKNCLVDAQGLPLVPNASRENCCTTSQQVGPPLPGQKRSHAAG
jgi:site-specific DNA-cytosine methylase